MKILEQIKRQVEEIMLKQKQSKISKSRNQSTQKNIRRKLSSSSLEQGHKSPRTEQVQIENPLMLNTGNVSDHLIKQASYKIIEQGNSSQLQIIFSVGGEFQSQTWSYVKYLNTMIVFNAQNQKEIVPLP